MSESDTSERNISPLKAFGYLLMWFGGNALLIVFLISCWKFGPLSKRGDIIFFSFLHLMVLVGLYKIHKKYYEGVRKFFLYLGF
jgi:hypothetical protein